MIILKEADFRKELKGDPRVGYLFFGEEDYMKTASIRQARATVCGAEGASMQYFNDVRLDGLDFSPDKLLDAMMVPPLGAERKIITVTGLNFNTMRASDADKLCETLAALEEYPYCLVIVSVGADAMDYGTLPKRPSDTLTELAEYLTPVYFERNTPAKLAGWVEKHYRHNGVDASADVCRETIAYCGRDMFILAQEIDKVSFFVLAAGRSEVMAEDLRAAAVPVTEYDAFAFTNAVMERRLGDALDILHDLKFRRVEPLFILSEVSRVICDLLSVRALADAGKTAAEIASVLKMHEYRVGLYMRQARAVDADRLARAAEACRDADRAVKLSSGGYGVIERLICSI